MSYSIDPISSQQLGAQESIELYFIAQEAILATATHKAIKFSSHFSHDSKVMMLRIEDDGCGFDSAKVSANGVYLGTKIMQYRAKSIGWNLSLSSPSGGGSVVECGKSLQALGGNDHSSY